MLLPGRALQSPASSLLLELPPEAVLVGSVSGVGNEYFRPRLEDRSHNGSVVVLPDCPMGAYSWSPWFNYSVSLLIYF